MKKSNKVYNWDSSNLKKLVEASGSSYAMTAAKAGLGDKQLRDYLDQKTCPSIVALMKLSDLFEVPIDYLMCRCSEEEATTFFDNWTKNYKSIQKDRLEELLLRKKEFLDIPSGYDLPWPYNLYEKIFSKIPDHVLSKDELDGIEYVLSKLPEQLTEIILLYFKEGKTCADIGRKLNYHRESIRAKLSEGIRIMRQPAFLGYIKDGKATYMKKLHRNKNMRETISNLPLSARAYNVLVISNKILYIDELLAAVNSGRLINSRNVGQKTYNEIIDVINQRYGYNFANIDSQAMRKYKQTLKGDDKHEEEAVS